MAAFITRHNDLGGNRAATAPAEGAIVPFPPCVSLGTVPSESAIIEALSVLDPLNRLGGDRNPVFLSLQLATDQGRRFSYLGLTSASQRWLAGASPDGQFAAACRAGLTDAFRRGGVSPVPDRQLDQVCAAVRILAREHPAVELMLTVMPLGLGPGNGSGIAYSCDPVTGEPGLAGLFGTGRTGAQLLSLGGTELAPEAAVRGWGGPLADFVRAAQERAGRPVRVEFVVTDGEVYPLRVDHFGYSGHALVRAVVGLARGGHLDTSAALAAITDADLADALVPVVDTRGLPIVAKGQGASPGVASGTAVFDPAEAVAARRSGRPVILVLAESRPEHLAGLLAAAAVVTEHGGRTSHAAVVARGLGRPCVTALRAATVDAGARCMRLADGNTVVFGDEITVDGRSGVVLRGNPELAAPDRGGSADEVAWLLAQVPDVPGLVVRCNADNAEAAQEGRAAGAAGVGLCRIEHMFLGERQRVLERAMLGPRGADGAEAFAAVYEILRADFTALLSVMDGSPVVVRLLDPPRHEFLPDIADLTAQAAVAAATGSAPPDAGRLAVARRLREANPMLGTRGVRLAILMPELTRWQIRALIEATVAVRRAGGDPHPELLVPMVADPAELDAVRQLVIDVADRLGQGELGRRLPVGAMIETPRAALLAGALATRCDFLSFGTNDLSALVWGLSRDDAENELLPAYRELGVAPESPFERLDVAGVGVMVRNGVAAARAARPGITVGVCGEHASETSALRFFADAGVTYVSCVPSAVPAIRFAAARLAGAWPADPNPPARESLGTTHSARPR